MHVNPCSVESSSLKLYTQSVPVGDFVPTFVCVPGVSLLLWLTEQIVWKYWDFRACLLLFDLYALSDTLLNLKYFSEELNKVWVETGSFSSRGNFSQKQSGITLSQDCIDKCLLMNFMIYWAFWDFFFYLSFFFYQDRQWNSAVSRLHRDSQTKFLRASKLNPQTCENKCPNLGICRMHDIRRD